MKDIKCNLLGCSHINQSFVEHISQNKFQTTVISVIKMNLTVQIKGLQYFRLSINAKADIYIVLHSYLFCSAGSVHNSRKGSSETNKIQLEGTAGTGTRYC